MSALTRFTFSNYNNFNIKLVIYPDILIHNCDSLLLYFSHIDPQ